MNLDRILAAIRALGAEPVGVSDATQWEDVTRCSDIDEYLQYCITVDGFDCSGIGFSGEGNLRDENLRGVTPGGKIRKYGYIAIAGSVGGNAVVLSSSNGMVYWADHSFFALDDQVSFRDSAGNWKYVPWDSKNVESALIPLSDSIETFLLEATAGDWEDRFDDLD